MFNKCKIEFKKLNHINLVDDINVVLNKITSTDCKRYYNHMQTILNKYKN